ncbi:MAG: BrnT family toxin [Rhizobacter sp.]|nr:BrnT family toxin [Bacteriovorax sp.]
MEFEWDPQKEKLNLHKHGVPFSESIETFSDINGIELDDLKHSEIEIRLYWIGKTKNDRVLTTWFTRKDEIIRSIGSAEWRKFRKYYYETTQIK